MCKSLQQIAEEKVYNILFELENELGIETGKIPEVYYVGKTTSFNKLGLDEFCKEFVGNKMDEVSTAFTLNNPAMIVTSTIKENHLAEEVGHFMHFNYINLNYETMEELFAFNALKEMIGFFCSKLIDSKRINPYRNLNDFFPKKFSKKKFFKVLNKISNQNPLQFENGFYIQGYGMGEKMFNRYIFGRLSKRKIRKIITNPLDSKYETLYQFYNWKYQILKD